jgi:TetR/AcrR family transcriptional regulator, ethionamide resistance regulator
MPPRRAKRPDGEARAALLDAAERLLGDRRIADLTVADVLARAEVSRASFYFYFGSKYDLVVALAQQIMDEVEQASAPWLDRGELAPEEALRAASRGALEVWRTHGSVLRAIAESWHASPELGDVWGAFVERFVTRAQAQIERERAAGTAPADGPDAATLAASLIWMNERVFYLWATEAQPQLGDADTVVDTLTAIWHGAVYGG